MNSITEVTCFSNTPAANSPTSIPLKQITLIGGLINKFKNEKIVCTVATKANTIAIYSSTRDVGVGIAHEYEQAHMEGYEELFLLFLQVEDEEITHIETALGNQLLIHRKGQEIAENLYLNSQPSNLGRLAIMAATLISEGFLSIDEIENGLHHSQYEKLWATIFEAVYYLGEAQVVATTHSLEMIKAFVKVALLLEEQNECSPSSSYIEIAATADTGELIAIKRDAEIVVYAIEHEDGVRGEAKDEDPEVKFS